MTTITIRLTEEEAQYLEQIASNAALFKSSKKRSTGKVLKALLAWCQQNNFAPADLNSKLDPTKKLIEQMHVTIPHILYLLRLHILLDSDKIPDSTVHNSKLQAMEYLNSVCGGFQNIDYKEINATPNDFGLKQLPITKEESHWTSGGI